MKELRQFRRLLPIAQTLLAFGFGGVGLWQRDQIISHSVFGWNSSLVYHVWPWPFRLAAVINMPAFLAGGVASLPIDYWFPKAPEWIDLIPGLTFVPLLWYWIGRWIDDQCGKSRDKRGGIFTAWAALVVFVGVCAVSVMPALSSSTAFISYGLGVWTFACLVVRVALHIHKRCTSGQARV